ncbi:MAG: hypothetical protein EAS52_24680 [Parapedobacter sp.]|nr:MAG: hypothetical protein EAS52_24680 [Parapedobacter sp.]
MSTRQYEASLKNKWDTQNAFDSVRREERARAHAEKLNAAVELKKIGLLTNQQIAESLNLPLAVVGEL